jgi:hypothetical protein
VLEGEPDYDIRARLTLRYRFFGGAEPRVEQIGARARAADARAQRIREQAEREASIAWSDVQALEEQFAALRENYVASRRTRDVQVERFRVSRGTIVDVLEANESYFETAVAYVLAMSELDAARYVLLSRTGKLLDALEIDRRQAKGRDDVRQSGSRAARALSHLARRADAPQQVDLHQGRARGGDDQRLRPGHLAVHDDGLRPGAAEQRDRFAVALSIGLAIVIVFDFLLRTLRAYFVDVAGAQVDREVGRRAVRPHSRDPARAQEGLDGSLTGLLREFETLRDFFASATLTAVVDVPFIL